MARDKKQVQFGLHQMTIRDYFSGLPICAVEVVGDLTLPVTAEVEDLIGGDSPWPVAGEAKALKCEGSIELREFPEEAAEYLAAAVGAKTATSATGTISSVANYYGTSCMSATTGVATATMTTGKVADLKAGRYMIKVISASTVDVYPCSTVDLKKGTAVTLADDSLKITATPLTITTGSATVVPNTGIELTGGSGTIGMTVNDTAYFDVWPPHAGVEVVTFGADTNVFKRVAITFSASKRTTGEIGFIDCPNALALGVPSGLKEKGWSSGSTMIKVYRHETLNYSMQFTNIAGTSV